MRKLCTNLSKVIFEVEKWEKREWKAQNRYLKKAVSLSCANFLCFWKVSIAFSLLSIREKLYSAFQ